MSHWNRAQVIGFAEVSLRHDVEATFDVVDTDAKGGHAIRATWIYKAKKEADKVEQDYVGIKVYRLPIGGGVVELGPFVAQN